MERRDEQGRSVTVRRMTATDVPEGLRLCRASNWNQLEDDWRVFLDRGGAFVAEENGAIVGTVAWLPFGEEFTWLSMMLVDPAARRSGIGTRLMEACLDAIGDGACVRLDATPFGEPMYRRFGFVDEYQLARAFLTSGAEHRRSPRVRPITPADLPAILERDREVFGAGRGALLADLLRRAPELAWQSDAAYCFGRPGYIRPQIGPVVADDLAAADEVLGHCLAGSLGATFTIDIPLRPGAFPVRVERPFLRMCRGKLRDGGMTDRVFAITGPEFG
jgi:predicted N-acetyltransferase YhbS